MVRASVWSDPFEFSGQVMSGREGSTEVCYQFLCGSLQKTKPCQQLMGVLQVFVTVSGTGGAS